MVVLVRVEDVEDDLHRGKEGGVTLDSEIGAGVEDETIADRLFGLSRVPQMRDAAIVIGQHLCNGDPAGLVEAIQADGKTNDRLARRCVQNVCADGHICFLPKCRLRRARATFQSECRSSLPRAAFHPSLRSGPLRSGPLRSGLALSRAALRS